jgi:hypothetical protein
MENGNFLLPVVEALRGPPERREKLIAPRPWQKGPG